MTKIREGYKETEIGVIPEDWEVRKVEECVKRILGGGTPTRSNIEFYSGNIPWITVKDLDNKFYKDDAIEYITKDAIENSATNLIDENSVIIATRMGLGRGFINTKPVAINQDMKALILNQSIESTYFLFWYLSKASMIEGLGTGTTVKGIRLETLRSLKLPLPPLPEQQRIAEILSTTDEHIEKLDKTIEEYQLLKKGMMKKLLTEGIGHSEFNDTEIGKIPKEWDLRRIGEMVKIQGGYAFKSKNFSDCGIPIIRISNINNGRIDLSECTYYPKDLTTNLESFLLEENNTVIAMSGATTGKVGIVSKDILPCYLNQRVGRFSIKESKLIDKMFLYYYTNSYYFQEKIWDYAIGGAQPNISGAQIESIYMPIPSRSEQNYIVSIFKLIDGKIDLYQQQQQDFIQLKKALMEKLLTGKIRTI